MEIEAPSVRLPDHADRLSCVYTVSHGSHTQVATGQQNAPLKASVGLSITRKLAWEDRRIGGREGGREGEFAHLHCDLLLTHQTSLHLIFLYLYFIIAVYL